MKTLLVWVVMGYNQQQAANLEDVCYITVYAEDEKEAIAKAQKLISKAHYRIHTVTELRDVMDDIPKQIMRGLKPKQPWEADDK